MNEYYWKKQEKLSNEKVTRSRIKSQKTSVDMLMRGEIGASFPKRKIKAAKLSSDWSSSGAAHSITFRDVAPVQLVLHKQRNYSWLVWGVSSVMTGWGDAYLRSKAKRPASMVVESAVPTAGSIDTRPEISSTAARAYDFQSSASSIIRHKPKVSPTATPTSGNFLCNLPAVLLTNFTVPFEATFSTSLTINLSPVFIVNFSPTFNELFAASLSNDFAANFSTDLTIFWTVFKVVLVEALISVRYWLSSSLTLLSIKISMTSRTMTFVFIVVSTIWKRIHLPVRTHFTMSTNDKWQISFSRIFAENVLIKRKSSIYIADSQVSSVTKDFEFGEGFPVCTETLQIEALWMESALVRTHCTYDNRQNC